MSSQRGRVAETAGLSPREGSLARTAPFDAKRYPAVVTASGVEEAPGIIRGDDRIAARLGVSRHSPL
jgi:hypothetical protein